MKRLLIIVFPLILGACSLIDDDLKACGDELVIEYQVQLHTELDMQLQTELSTDIEEPVRRTLKNWLDPIFSDVAKDVDFRFYLSDTDSLRHRIQKEINGNHATYTIRLPQENYMHLAVANMAGDRQVQLSGEEYSATMAMHLPDGEDIQPLRTGLYTARLPMIMNDTIRHFDVHMYMVTAAVALVIDTAACKNLQDMDGYMLGAANSFYISDSVFEYDRPCVFLLERVPVDTQANHIAPSVKQQKSNEPLPIACLGTVGFPTQNDTTGWNLVVTATLIENRHTTTTLTIKDPLEAGTLRIIKCAMDENGALDPNPNTEHYQEVGATVEFDWKPGDNHDVDI